MKNILILVLVTASFFSSAQNCSHLKNGTYKLVYDNAFKNYPPRTYEINDNTCYVTENGKKEKYELSKTYACRFRLISNEIVDTTKLTKFQKTLLREKPFYDIYKVEGNSYYFILRIDLHVQSYSGKFVKIDN